MNGKTQLPDATPCVYCGAKPLLLEFDSNMYYVLCSKCSKHRDYAYLGIRPNVAIQRWEEANRPTNRNGNPSKWKWNLHIKQL